MASASIKEHAISYSVITENDVDAVIQLLKDTFFKVIKCFYFVQNNYPAGLVPFLNKIYRKLLI